MDIVLPLVLLAFLAALVTAGVTWRLRSRRAAQDAARNDLRRAGEDADATPEGAALRAQGKTAWMRPSGL